MLSNCPTPNFHIRLLTLLALAMTTSLPQPKIPESSKCEWLRKDANGWLMPYFTQPFLEQLSSWDISHWSIFNWNVGEGFTPAWLARKCRRLICVEHRPEWQQALNNFFQQKRLAHAHCLLGALERKTTPHPLFGTQEINTMNYLGEQNSYVQAIDQTAELYDCIIIDGMHRNACAVAALRHIKPGGIIILNNANQATIGCNSQPTFALLRQYPHFSYQQPNHLDWCTDYWIIS